MLEEARRLTFLCGPASRATYPARVLEPLSPSPLVVTMASQAVAQAAQAVTGSRHASRQSGSVASPLSQGARRSGSTSLTQSHSFAAQVGLGGRVWRACGSPLAARASASALRLSTPPLHSTQGVSCIKSGAVPSAGRPSRQALLVQAMAGEHSRGTLNWQPLVARNAAREAAGAPATTPAVAGRAPWLRRWRTNPERPEISPGLRGRPMPRCPLACRCRQARGAPVHVPQHRHHGAHRRRQDDHH